MHEVRENTASYVVEKTGNGARPVRLFRNGANQAVRIPKEFELPGQDALIYRDGERLIIEAVKPSYPKGSPQALLAALDAMAALGPLDDQPDPWADIDAGLLPLDDIRFDDDLSDE